ncbi:MAG: hypothetical protein AVDCRST_MAG30-1960 [uncultured Solirubrobacteraceae bacterium]|uniref:DUF3618 domain-containing protein n=1 Tax=uncultured Solirubrobacteraceae bacterium TaxID=1162706 RepID=A0A6J4SLC5_9ACTN|nr:MAG: hypothetical protein AVDCRST_MAG30-1960 [uncultured Solirubrobacteraceae bacterium]
MVLLEARPGRRRRRLLARLPDHGHPAVRPRRHRRLPGVALHQARVAAHPEAGHRGGAAHQADDLVEHRHPRVPFGGEALMGAARSPEEIRQSIEANRVQLGEAVERLRAEVTELTDWRKKLIANRRNVLIGAAVAGFVLGGGFAAVGGLFSRDD